MTSKEEEASTEGPAVTNPPVMVPPPAYAQSTAAPATYPAYGQPIASPAPYPAHGQPIAAPAPDQGYGQPQIKGYGQPQIQGYGQPQMQGYGQPQNWSELNAAPVISSQPGAPVYMVQQQQSNVHVPDQMCFSIFTTLFCCCYLGIPAMILSSQANSMRLTEPDRALRKANTARALNITALVIGSIVLIISLVIRFTVTTTSYSYTYG